MNPGKSYNDYVDEFNKGQINIDYKGNKVKCDPISINDNGKLILTGCFLFDDENELNDLDKIAKKNHYSYDGKKVSELQKDNTHPITYTEYKIGNQITVAGQQYYVIADSGINQDYVVALKVDYLKKNEIMGTLVHGYGADVIYDYCTNNNCNTDYDSSSIKVAVNNWAESKFTNNELKNVDGYTARLIKLDELISIFGYSYDVSATSPKYIKSASTPDWIYSYYYWTMSSYADSNNEVWRVDTGGNLVLLPIMSNNAYHYQYIRPVINVYKSKIQ
jgi:hypothetical protein